MGEGDERGFSTVSNFDAGGWEGGQPPLSISKSPTCRAYFLYKPGRYKPQDTPYLHKLISGKMSWHIFGVKFSYKIFQRTVPNLIRCAKRKQRPHTYINTYICPYNMISSTNESRSSYTRINFLDKWDLFICVSLSHSFLSRIFCLFRCVGGVAGSYRTQASDWLPLTFDPSPYFPYTNQCILLQMSTSSTHYI